MSSFDTPERRALRELTRRFVAREVLPYLDGWERAGEVPRDLHLTAAKLGLLGIGFPEEVGGSGGDLLDTVVVTEELIRAGGSSGLVAALFTHGIAVPHIVSSGDARLVDAYVRPTLAGERIGALAVTEPDTGSDVAAIRTTARRDGDHYVVNGTKTYITSGARADFVTTAVRTGPDRISLLVVEGATVTRRLEKLGWHCSDTAELSYVDVRVPVGNLVGEEGTGFGQIVRHFATERLSLAVQAYATAQRCRREPGRRSANPSRAARWSGTGWPRWPARWTSPVRMYGRSRSASQPASRSSRRWRWRRTPRSRPATTSSTRPFNCTVASAVYATPRSSGTTGTPAFWASGAAPRRS